MWLAGALFEMLLASMLSSAAWASAISFKPLHQRRDGGQL
jgi:hypothetical protein